MSHYFGRGDSKVLFSSLILFFFLFLFYFFNSYLSGVALFFLTISFIWWNHNQSVFIMTNLVFSWGVFQCCRLKVLLPLGRSLLLLCLFGHLSGACFPFCFGWLPLMLDSYFLLCSRFIFTDYYILDCLLYRYHSKDPKSYILGSLWLFYSFCL